MDDLRTTDDRIEPSGSICSAGWALDATIRIQAETIGPSQYDPSIDTTLPTVELLRPNYDDSTDEANFSETRKNEYKDAPTDPAALRSPLPRLDIADSGPRETTAEQGTSTPFEFTVLPTGDTYAAQDEVGPMSGKNGDRPFHFMHEKLRFGLGNELEIVTGENAIKGDRNSVVTADRHVQSYRLNLQGTVISGDKNGVSRVTFPDGTKIDVTDKQSKNQFETVLPSGQLIKISRQNGITHIKFDCAQEKTLHVLLNPEDTSTGSNEFKIGPAGLELVSRSIDGSFRHVKGKDLPDPQLVMPPRSPGLILD